MKNISKYFFILATFYTFISKSQDIHFSQYDDNPALVNPALTGADNTLRASVCYREQWRSIISPYKTSGLSFELRFKPNEWQQVDKFRSMTFKEKTMGRVAAGLSIYNSRDGASGFVTTSSNLSFATFVPINANHFLSFGVQASLVQRKMENGNYIYSNQFNGSAYDKDLPSGEKFNTFNLNYPDFSTGILWSYRSEESRVGETKIIKANAGLAYYHLTQPRQEFLQKSSFLSPRIVLHGKLHYEESSDNFAIEPSFIVQKQNSGFLFTGGFLVKNYLKENSRYTGIVKRSAFNYGVYYRSYDALILKLIFDLGEQYGIGLSYDVSVSSLSPVTSGRGGFEMLLRYTPPKGFLYQEKNIQGNN